MRTHTLLVVPILLSATLARAQTFVVDVLMGPGANFPDIATAVAAVPDGSAIEVRPGTYGNFTIDHKSLVISGLPGAQVIATILDVKVRNLAATQAVTLRQLAFGATGAPGELRCEYNLGRVVVQKCSLVVPTLFTAPSIVAVSTSDLHLVDVSLVGSTAHPLSLLSSRAFLSGCVLTPISNFSIGGILINNSSCEATDTAITTLGFASISSPIQFLSPGTATLRGGCRLQTMAGTSAQPLVAGSGTLWLDPTVQLISGSTLFGTGVNVSVVAMPRVTALSASLGTPATATLTLPPGAVGGLWFGLAAPPTLVPPFTTPVQIAFTIALPVTAGIAATQTATIPLPNLPWLRGIGIAWQGCSFEPTNGFQASNAVVFTAW